MKCCVFVAFLYPISGRNRGQQKFSTFGGPSLVHCSERDVEPETLTDTRYTEMKFGWLYRQGDRIFGPVSSSELKQLANAGELKPDDLVSNEGTEKWVKAKNVKGLVSVQAVPPPIQPPLLPQHNQAEDRVRQVVGQSADSNQSEHKLPLQLHKLSLSAKLASGGCLLVGVFFLICCGGLVLPFGSKTWTAQELATYYATNPDAVKLNDTEVTVTGTVMRTMGFTLADGSRQYGIKLLGAEDHEVRCSLLPPHPPVEELLDTRVTIQGTLFGATVTNGGYGTKYVSIQDCTLLQGSASDGIPASGSMSRQEALFALKSLGAQVSDDWYRDENGVPKTDCVLRATKDQWSSLVGEPEMLSPGFDSFLGSKYERWRIKCSDGPLTFHGDIFTYEGKTQLESMKVLQE